MMVRCSNRRWPFTQGNVIRPARLRPEQNAREVEPCGCCRVQGNLTRGRLAAMGSTLLWLDTVIERRRKGFE